MRPCRPLSQVSPGLYATEDGRWSERLAYFVFLAVGVFTVLGLVGCRDLFTLPSHRWTASLKWFVATKDWFGSLSWASTQERY